MRFPERIDNSHRSMRPWTFETLSQIVGTGVIAGILLTVALLAAMGTAVLLIAVVSPRTLEDRITVLITFGLTATMVSKLCRLF